MIINNLQNINFDHDYTIIGSGPASLTLAMSLEEKGFSSIIFEAGGLEPTDESQSYYTGEVSGDHYFTLVCLDPEIFANSFTEMNQLDEKVRIQLRDRALESFEELNNITD